MRCLGMPAGAVSVLQSCGETGGLSLSHDGEVIHQARGIYPENKGVNIKQEFRSIEQEYIILGTRVYISLKQG